MSSVVDSRLFAVFNGFVLLPFASPHLPPLVRPTVCPCSRGVQALLICCLISADECLGVCACERACMHVYTGACACVHTDVALCACAHMSVCELSHCEIFCLCMSWLVCKSISLFLSFSFFGGVAAFCQ